MFSEVVGFGVDVCACVVEVCIESSVVSADSYTVSSCDEQLSCD